MSCKKDEPPPPPPPADPDCGNGMLEEGEVCEGMPTPVGCNPNTCQVEVGWACSPEPPDTSAGETGDPFMPIEWTSTCEELDTCGDGIKDPNEDCDDGDGNTQEGLGDGCSNCTIDPLWSCMTPPGMPSECWQCGDAFLDSEYGEECDDGHASPVTGMDTPGCNNNTCTVEPGWECFQGAGQFSLCQPKCGDGIWFDSSVPGVNLASAEGCDDGNLIEGDGCDSNCNVEPDCSCSGQVGEASSCMCDTGDSSGGSDSGSSDSGSTGGSDTGGSSSTGV
ncbi:MAG: DUF4215 domain-containing protein [Myxococcales bacterium]|nr:DUF4215 domain-containing protein [Myxococcales bacterium]